MDKAQEYYQSLDKDKQELIDKVMLCTIDMCNELNRNIPKAHIMFPEDMAYKVFRKEMLEHLLDNEYYDNKTNVWHQLRFYEFTK